MPSHPDANEIENKHLYDLLLTYGSGRNFRYAINMTGTSKYRSKKTNSWIDKYNDGFFIWDGEYCHNRNCRDGGSPIYGAHVLLSCMLFRPEGYIIPLCAKCNHRMNDKPFPILETSHRIVLKSDIRLRTKRRSTKQRIRPRVIVIDHGVTNRPKVQMID